MSKKITHILFNHINDNKNDDVRELSMFYFEWCFGEKNNLEDMHWDKKIVKKMFYLWSWWNLYFISKSVSNSIAIWRKNNLEDMHWDNFFLKKNVLFVILMNFVFHKQVCIWLHSDMKKNNLEDMHWDNIFFKKKCFICDSDKLCIS